MNASYGETSGFSPVSGGELENVNGGEPLATAAAVVGTLFVIAAFGAVIGLWVDAINKKNGK